MGSKIKTESRKIFAFAAYGNCSLAYGDAFTEGSSLIPLKIPKATKKTKQRGVQHPFKVRINNDKHYLYSTFQNTKCFIKDRNANIKKKHLRKVKGETALGGEGWN